MPNPMTKKLGPLPRWAWVAGGVLFIGMVWYFRRSMSTSETTATSFDYTSGEQIAGSLPGGEEMTYISSGGGAPAGGSYDSSIYAEGVPVGYPPDFFDRLLGSIGAPYAPIYESPQAPYQTQPVAPDGGTQVVATKTSAPAKQSSFQWGGRTWTAKDQAAFRAWLKQRGQSYATWAKNHPKAAMDVFGTMS